MSNYRKNPRGRTLTERQKKTFEALSLNGGKMADAMRQAGYSKSMVKNPHKVTKSKAFSQLLDKAGLTDVSLAERHRQLIEASNVQKETFQAVKVKGKWKHLTDQEIKIIIEGTVDDPTGCKLMFIKLSKSRFLQEKIAIYRAPNHIVRKSAIEMAHKIKGHFAPEKHLHTVEPMTDEEQAEIEAIFSENS